MVNFYHKSFPLPGVLSVPGVPELVVLLLHWGAAGAGGGVGGGGHRDVFSHSSWLLWRKVQKSHIRKYIHADIADIHASPSWTPDLRQKQAPQHMTHHTLLVAIYKTLQTRNGLTLSCLLSLHFQTSLQFTCCSGCSFIMWRGYFVTGLSTQLSCLFCLLVGK